MLARREVGVSPRTSPDCQCEIGSAARDRHVAAGRKAHRERGGAFGNVEASRRVGDSGKLVIELRLFVDADEADPLYFLRRDDYLQVEYIRYF